ncbi:hypothetical protein V1520DRAFT_281419 [Lipomyces starkeyi]|uniref:Uncharacterized protein n=1 Tax=Lipomyces starkeyi NRRL Y-11557 TaxID=675824 RepID=A0A1E3PW16_LIPST|nr:hypothetical protein LIPSTDRAFT_66239 [Lipomyces starkeyi NRRL Y-11557]
MHTISRLRSVKAVDLCKRFTVLEAYVARPVDDFRIGIVQCCPILHFDATWAEEVWPLSSPHAVVPWVLEKILYHYLPIEPGGPDWNQHIQPVFHVLFRVSRSNEDAMIEEFESGVSIDWATESTKTYEKGMGNSVTANSLTPQSSTTVPSSYHAITTPLPVRELAISLLMSAPPMTTRRSSGWNCLATAAMSSGFLLSFVYISGCAL